MVATRQSSGCKLTQRRFFGDDSSDFQVLNHLTDPPDPLDPPAKRFGKALSLSWHCLGIVAVSLVETGTAIRAVHAQTELKRPVTMSMVHSVQPSPAADPCYVKHLMLNAKQARTGERWHGVCH